MSKLLLEEPALQVLPTLAIHLGLNEAVFLQQLHFLTREKRPGPDGYQWIRKTYPEWKKSTFPFWSVRTIERTAKSLAKLNLILVEQRDKSNRNRHNYYAVNREFYDEWEATLGKSDGGFEPAKMAASEDANLADSDTAKMADSLKDQISLDLNTRSNPLPPTKGNGKLKLPRKDEPPIEPPFESSEFLQSLAEFEAVQKERNRKLTPTRRQKIYSKMIEWGEDTSIAALEAATSAGYPDIYYPKNLNSTGQSYSKHHKEPQKYGDYISEDEHFVYSVGPEGPGGTVMRKPKTPEGVSMISGIPVEEVRKLWN